MTRGDHAMQLTGIHHLTAISAKPRENLAFYRGLLGMRLVKKTVNQDDVTHHTLSPCRTRDGGLRLANPPYELSSSAKGQRRSPRDNR